MSTATKTRTKVSLRKATPDDLMFINGIIETSVMSWQLPERVKRLTLPNYRYKAEHFESLTLYLATGKDSMDVLGVLAIGEAAEEDVPNGQRATLVHGVYVDPINHREGIGKKLVAHAMKAAKKAGMDGLVVTAQPDSIAFFEAIGFARCEMPKDDEAEFRNVFWKPAA
ncbi:MAG: GNAT family N-acetyltransferase [Pseudomonadota bacterium]